MTSSDFDHEAILGSAREAEMFDHLPPEKAKERLSLILTRMDLSGDQKVSKEELNQWILRSFSLLSREESQERFDDADHDKDGKITWREFKIEEHDLEVGRSHFIIV